MYNIVTVMHATNFTNNMHAVSGIKQKKRCVVVFKFIK